MNLIILKKKFFKKRQNFNEFNNLKKKFFLNNFIKKMPILEKIFFK